MKGPLAGKIASQKNNDDAGTQEFSEQMFTYLSAGDLEKLVAAGGKKGKAAGKDDGKGALEKVEYMKQDELKERQ